METITKTEEKRSKPLQNRLKSLRNERNMTLRELGEVIDVTPQAIYKAENKGTGINRHKWYKLADYFGIDPRLLETPENI